jgi:3-oxoacyl-[acyl-carrier-protein] synthase II
MSQKDRRVVVTGASGVTALGNNWQTIYSNMAQKKNGVRLIEDWRHIQGLNCLLGAPVENFTVPEHYTRKQMRAMGRVAKLATIASETALAQAGLLSNQTLLESGRVGISYGSCFGSSAPVCDLASIFFDKSVGNITATTYVKAMSHTCAVNLALFFGVTGRVIPTSSACTSGSQGIGYAYEAIKHGYQDVMIAGGAEELCPSQTVVFDTLYATTQKNDTPHLTPRPFDKDRDGLVIGEGAGTLILEELSHAENRGATILAELVGFSTNCDAKHITQPTADIMQKALELALIDANLTAKDIDFVSAHGTATDRGDLAESVATHAVFGDNKPISSLKSYFGHTLGACAAIEAWLGIEMMNAGKFMPTINLENVDPACAPLNYITEETQVDCHYFMSNNFAFGGINTSLIFKRWDK